MKDATIRPMANSRISKRIGSIAESATLAVDSKAKALKAAGRPVIGFGAGEPDFPTPDLIVQAAVAAAQNPAMHRYSATNGLPALREAIAKKTLRDSGFEVDPAQVLVTNGGKQALYNTFATLLDPGDEVIVVNPYWTTYPEAIALAGGTSVIVPTDETSGYRATVAQLEAARTTRTKVLLFVSPSNPTGAVYSKEELESLAKILTKHPNILIGTDDMYEHVKLKDIPFYNILNVEPSLKDRCVVMNGVSKAYSMTGWRIGFAAGPSYIIKAMEILQSQSTSNPTSISQVAAEAALSGEQACMQPMIKAFRERHDYVVKSFNEIPGLSCIEAQGAFYAFPDARKAIERLYDQKILKEKTDLALADYLLEKEGVAVVPGSAFGSDGYFRISFATSMDNLVEAMKRIKRALTV